MVAIGGVAALPDTFVGTSRAQLCPGVSYAKIPTGGSVQSRLTNYFNASALCDISLIGQVGGVGGTTGNGNSGRGIVLGPDQFNWDIAGGKGTRVGGLREDANLDFRAEFFNTLTTRNSLTEESVGKRGTWGD
jgi:hypothetical protein